MYPKTRFKSLTDAADPEHALKALYNERASRIGLTSPKRECLNLSMSVSRRARVEGCHADARVHEVICHAEKRFGFDFKIARDCGS